MNPWTGLVFDGDKSWFLSYGQACGQRLNHGTTAPIGFPWNEAARARASRMLSFHCTTGLAKCLAFGGFHGGRCWSTHDQFKHVQSIPENVIHIQPSIPPTAWTALWQPAKKRVSQMERQAFQWRASRTTSTAFGWGSSTKHSCTRRRLELP